VFDLWALVYGGHAVHFDLSEFKISLAPVHPFYKVFFGLTHLVLLSFGTLPLQQV